MNYKYPKYNYKCIIILKLYMNIKIYIFSNTTTHIIKNGKIIYTHTHTHTYIKRNINL